MHLAVETELYDLLGVAPDASESDIKKAYRRKAKEHHPDKNPNDPEAAQKFQEMAAAYEILSEANSREAYDSHGMAGLNGNGGPPGMDPADLFAHFFTTGVPEETFGYSFDPSGRTSGQRKAKGQDSVIPYEVTLEDLYNGKAVKMNMEKEILCGTCKGSGARGNAKPKKCATCEGKGWQHIQTQISPSRIGISRVKCHECDGHGEKLREKDKCKKCKGEKVVSEKTRQEIFIEKGMADRQRIVLPGAGDQEPGVTAGDVIFVLKCASHESFERSGNDLLTNVTITLSEALLGFSRILITHLDGRGIKVTSRPNKITRPHDTILIRGEGMPMYKQSDQKGDLYILFNIELPDEQWLKTVDRRALEALLPPKKIDVEPRPAVIDEADFEESDIADFGEDEEDWEDDDEDGEHGEEPDCRPQ